MIQNLNILSILGKSDHTCISFKYICQRQKVSKHWTQFYYDKGDYSKISDELNLIELEQDPIHCC